ncbi:MAG: ComF family protein [Anaerolineae bacterium]|nr:ComF family protein [Anaerolineae bacterium]
MKSATQTVRRCYYWLLDLFMPPLCAVCGRVGTWLCETCAQQLLPFDSAICPRCGRPWEGGKLCPRCNSDPLNVNLIRSAFLFKDEIRDIIYALKYRGGSSVARSLAQTLAGTWKKYEMQSDLLVPIPLYPHREAKRGYNQSTLLARALSQEIRIPVAEHLLIRVRNTPSQTKLNQQQRKINVSGAFICNQTIDLSGLRVTLIDDVATTGATLDACASVLLDCQTSVVNAFTLARAS